MKAFRQTLWLLVVLLSWPLAAQASKLLLIKSDPVGATVTIGGQSLGPTPILSRLDDFWFDGPASKESRFLSEPVVMTISKEGFETKTELITKGPFEWTSPDGATKRTYYVVSAIEFNVKLQPAKNSSGPVISKQPAFVPPDNATWYKRAPEEINLKARLKLEKALSVKAAETDTEMLFGEGVISGPLLWDALKGQAGKELQEALPVDFYIRMPVPAKREGRGFVKPDQKRSFWNAFMEKIKGSNSTSIRRATKPEIDYYWSLISFDIEEPLYVADIGNQRILFCFLVKNGEPNVFWMDIVGEMATTR